MSTNQETFNVVITRQFDAQVESVWNAWHDPEQVKQWWGPVGFTVPVANMDFREGGTSLVCMRSPDGFEIYNTWTYHKIMPMQQIEYILNFADSDGKKLDPTSIGLPAGIPIDVRHVITFKELAANQTELNVTEFGYASEQVAAVSKSGMEECLDKMATALAKA